MLHGGAVDGPRAQPPVVAQRGAPRALRPGAAVGARPAGSGPRPLPLPRLERRRAGTTRRRQVGPRAGAGGIPRAAGGRRRPLDGRAGSPCTSATSPTCGSSWRSRPGSSRATPSPGPWCRTVVLHGDRDVICGLSRSRRLVEQLQSQGRDATLIRIARSDHAMLLRARLWTELVTGVTAQTFADELGLGGDGGRAPVRGRRCGDRPRGARRRVGHRPLTAASRATARSRRGNAGLDDRDRVGPRGYVDLHDPLRRRDQAIWRRPERLARA